MIMTSASPTFNGGEAGKFASRTPVNTGAKAEGCHPIHSQVTKDAVVATLKRKTKWSLAASAGLLVAQRDGRALAIATAGS